MNRDRAFKVAAMSLAGLVVIAYIIFLLIHKPVDVVGYQTISAGELDNGLEIDFAVTEVDTRLLQTHFQMRLKTQGEFAGPLGRQDMAGVPLEITIYGCDCDVEIGANEELPVITGTLPLGVLRSINSWPLDEYRSDVTLQVLSGESLVPISLQPSALTSAGFALTYSTPEGVDNQLISPGGGAIAQITISRSDDAQLIALVLSLGVALQVIVLIALAVAAVRGKRRLRLRDEFWITTFLIALPALRAALPGSPPLGINFDVFFFYWAILLVTCVFVIILLRVLIAPVETENTRADTSAIDTSARDPRP